MTDPDLMALLELTLLELQHSGALPATEMRRIEAAHQGLDGKVALRRILGEALHVRYLQHFGTDSFDSTSQLLV